MGKKVILIILAFILIFIVYHEIKTNDLKNAFSYIAERLNEKRPESRTSQMVEYLKEKAKKDVELNNESTLKSSLDYIKNNIENIKNVKDMENLIYYGFVLQYSPKSSDMAICTTIGIKTVEAVTDIYVTDNDYKKQKNDISKTNCEIIKALISRVDIN